MKSNQTAFLVLGMLSIEPNRSGYDIRKAVESSVGSFWRESYGQIYPTLKRLAAKGLIKACPSPSTGRRERQAYSITPPGVECLREWLAAPYQEDPPRNEFLLKLFFARSAHPEVATQHLTLFRRDNEDLLGALLNIEKQAKVLNAAYADLPYWLLTLSYGIAHTRASIDWSTQALEQLSLPGVAAPAGSRKKTSKLSPRTPRTKRPKH
jgi:DNA-binding PadR family transcriptional regulator